MSLILLGGGSGLGLLHLPWARQAILTYLQSRISESHGIVLEAMDLDYNLLVPWFQVRHVSIRSLGKTGLPPILKAERIFVRLRYWDLITGSGTADQISADGLALQWIIDKEGRDNLPGRRSKSAGAGLSGLPVRHLEITHVTFSLVNEQANFLLRLPQGIIRSQYIQAKGEQPVRYSTQQVGMIRWNGEELPLDQFSLESVLRRDSFEVHSLNLASADSRIQARGRLNNFDTPQLNFSVNSDVDCERLTKWLGSSLPASDRVKVSLAGAGTLDTVKLNASLISDRLTVAGVRSEPVAATLEYDYQSKVLRLEELAARIFSGVMRARGHIDTRERATNSALSIEVAHGDIRQAASALGWKAALPGVADVHLSLAWPGRHWQQLQVKAEGQVHAKRGKPGGLDSPLSFAANTRNRNGLVRIKIDSVSVPGATLHGNVDLRLDSTALEGRIQGSISSLARFSQSLESLTGHPAGLMTGIPIDGTAELTALLAGSAKRPLVSVDLMGSSLSAAKFKDATLQLQANYSPDRLELKEAGLQWRGQEATASGTIDLGSTRAPLHLEARLNELSIPEVANVYGVHPEINGTASARLSLSGSLSNPVANLTVATDGLTAYGEPLGRLTSEVILQNRKLTVVFKVGSS